MNRNGTSGGAVGKKSSQLHSESVSHPMAVTWQTYLHPWSLPLSKWSFSSYRIGVNEVRVFLFVSFCFFKENWKQAELAQDIKGEINAFLLLQQSGTVQQSQEMKITRFNSPDQKVPTLEMRDKVKWCFLPEQSFQRYTSSQWLYLMGSFYSLPIVWCKGYHPSPF